MSSARTWAIFGLVLGVALAGAAFVLPDATLAQIATTTGLDRVTPFAQPPFGQTARAVLAGGALAVSILLGLLIGRLARSAPIESGEDEAQPAVAARDWHAPAPLPRVAPDLPVAAQSTTPLAPAEAPAQTVGVTTSAIPPAPITPPMEPQPAAAVLAHVAQPQPDQPPSVADLSAPAPSMVEPIARLEAAVAQLAQRAPAEVANRFDSIDGRLQQMAQQIAELAALARAQQRTPAPAAADPQRPLPAPTNAAHRRAMAANARLLLARLGDPAVEPA